MHLQYTTDSKTIKKKDWKKALTVPQKEILDVILNFYDDNLRFPSYREMGKIIGRKRETAKFHCDAIHKKGLFNITVKPGKGLTARKVGYCMCKQMLEWREYGFRFNQKFY